MRKKYPLHVLPGTLGQRFGIHLMSRKSPSDAAPTVSEAVDSPFYPCLITPGAWGDWSGQQSTQPIDVGASSQIGEDYSHVMVRPDGGIIQFYREPVATSDLWLAELSPDNVLTETQVYTPASTDRVDDTINGIDCNARGVFGCSFIEFYDVTGNYRAWIYTSNGGAQLVGDADGLTDWFHNDIAIDANGKAHAVFNPFGLSGLFYSYDGALLTSVPGTTSSRSTHPRIAVDGLGVVHVFYDNLYLYSPDRGVTWSAQVPVFPLSTGDVRTHVYATKTGIVVFGVRARPSAGQPLRPMICWTNDLGTTFSDPVAPFSTFTGAGLNWGGIPSITGDWNGCRVFVSSQADYSVDPPECHILQVEADNTLTEVATVALNSAGNSGIYTVGSDENCQLIAARSEEFFDGIDVTLRLSRRTRADVCQV